MPDAPRRPFDPDDHLCAHPACFRFGPFGFGTGDRKAGTRRIVWACAEHRAEIDHQVLGAASPPPAPAAPPPASKQGLLL
jgi:hypothetical protein